MNRWFFVHPPHGEYRRPRGGALAAEGRRLGERDREAGVVPRDWPREELEARQADPRAYRRLMEAYEPVRWPERYLLAPPSWPAQLALIALATLLAALGERWELVLTYPVWEGFQTLDTYARRRSALRLGVDAERLPRRAVPATLLPYMLASLATGFRGRPTWSLYLASRIIGAVNERRSWRRAFRTAPGAPRA